MYINPEEFAELWYVGIPLLRSSYTKMEEALLHYAEAHFVNRLVLTDELYECQVMLIQERDRLKAENGRLTSVSITYEVNRQLQIAWFHIGQVCVTLFQVRKGGIRD